MDRNEDKRVIRLDDVCGDVAYLKCFNESRTTHALKRVAEQGLKSLARLEVEGLGFLNEKGYLTAELLFWGRTIGVGGMDGTFSFCALKDLTGFTELAMIDNNPLITRAREAASRVFLNLVNDGILWPDAHPEHFFISEDAGNIDVALIDLHGLLPKGSIREGKFLKKMAKRFLRLHTVDDKARFIELAGEIITNETLRKRVLKISG